MMVTTWCGASCATAASGCPPRRPPAPTPTARRWRSSPSPTPLPGRLEGDVMTVRTADGAALFRAVVEDPFADAPRLVCADWLEENGGEVPCPRCDRGDTRGSPKQWM